MYGAATATFYTAQHTARGKDYRKEADTVIAEIRKRRDRVGSLLDVACGTGGHLKTFAAAFGHVEGLDLSEPMLEIARGEVPGVPLHVGDMRAFDLGRSFDAVVCLFASIAYVTSLAELHGTLRCFARHTVPGGVVAVEPWWFPEKYIDRWISGDIVEFDDTVVARVAYTVRDGEASRMEVHYLRARPEDGVRHLTEVHRAMLFTREQYEEAFRRAGFEPEYVPEVQSGRGLFVGVRRSSPGPSR